jgi:hypothetical protein
MTMSAREYPPEYRRVAGYIIHDRDHNQIAHHEFFITSKFPDEDLADAMIRRWEHLVIEYPFPRYDVEYGLFETLESFQSIASTPSADR